MRHGHGQGQGSPVLWTPGTGESGAGWADDFGGTAGDTIATAPISTSWTVYDWYEEQNPGSDGHDEREQVNGRFRVRIQDNAGNSGNGKSLIWRTGGTDYYGVFIYKLLTVPFDVALYGCRVASQSDPTTFVPAMVSGGEYAFCGLGIRDPDDLSGEYEHCVVGYRAGVETLEWKRRQGATSIAQGDVGAFSSNEPVGSVRLAVDASNNRTWYYSESVAPVSWTEMTSGWGFVTKPDCINASDQVAVGINVYCFDDFVPDAGYYIDQAVRLD